MTTLHDCDLNAGLAATVQRVCSQYIVLGDSENQEFKSNVKKFSQNNIDLFVGSMKVSEILQVAMIPDLDFAQGNKEFSQYTHEQIDNLPTVPTRWQRPLKLSRERKIRNYFYVVGGAARQPKSVIPGAILLGEREEVEDYPANTVVKKLGAFGGNDMLEIQTTFNLRGACACGWAFPVGYTHSDRCGRHDPAVPPATSPTPCPQGNHRESVLPFQIIDGQHRVLGIMRADPDEEVPVVFLLRNKVGAEDEDFIGVRGCSPAVQAEVFEKVNNASEKLEIEHELWIKRLLTPLTSLSPEEVEAFDIMADLGKEHSWVPSNPWRDRVPMGPGGQGHFHIDSVRSSYLRATGSSGAVARIIPRLTHYSADGALGNPSPREQLTNFLKGATERSPAGNRATVWNLFHSRPRPFRRHRTFETILRSYDSVARWAISNSGALDHNAFTDAWELHATSFAPAYAPNWRNFVGSGEDRWREFANIWEHMWPIPPPGAGALPPVGPSWTGHANWGEYCNEAPDPISLVDPPTPMSAGSIGPRWEDNAGIINNIPAGVLDLVWEGPRNTVAPTTIYYRKENPVGSGVFDDWIEVDDGSVMTAHIVHNYEHRLSLDLNPVGLVTGQKIGFKIIDQNIVGGATEVEFEYEIT